MKKRYIKPWSGRFMAYMGRDYARKKAYFNLVRKWRKMQW